MPKSHLLNALLRSLTIVAVLCFASATLVAQSGDGGGSVIIGGRNKLVSLLNQKNFADAAQLAAQLVKDSPDDGELHFLLGFALLARSKQTDDAESGKLLAAQAITEIRKARELGLPDPYKAQADTIVKMFSEGGAAEEGQYSTNAEANKLMSQAEVFFSRSDYDRALEFYQKALALDPKLYEAALYSGDVMVQNGKFDEAETWYQKAITIDPERETAYRYSATPLMKQKKFDLARDRYVEAYITDPYNQSAVGGLVQWSKATGARLGHPRFNIPEYKIGPDGKSNTTINMDMLSDDGSIAWISYTVERTEWRESRFKKEFPNEKEYRHSLREEVAALQSVLSVAKEMKSKKKNPQFELLGKLNDEGLLEAYVLLARADEGIQADHLAYLRANRSKLRQYVLNYVIQRP